MIIWHNLEYFHAKYAVWNVTSILGSMVKKVNNFSRTLWLFSLALTFPVFLVFYESGNPASILFSPSLKRADYSLLHAWYLTFLWTREERQHSQGQRVWLNQSYYDKICRGKSFSSEVLIWPCFVLMICFLVSLAIVPSSFSKNRKKIRVDQLVKLVVINKS